MYWHRVRVRAMECASPCHWFDLRSNVWHKTTTTITSRQKLLGLLAASVTRSHGSTSSKHGYHGYVSTSCCKSTPISLVCRSIGTRSQFVSCSLLHKPRMELCHLNCVITLNYKPRQITTVHEFCFAILFTWKQLFSLRNKSTFELFIKFLKLLSY